jgi:hypothetical protein
VEPGEIRGRHDRRRQVQAGWPSPPA